MFLTYNNKIEHPVDFFMAFHEKFILKTKLHCSPEIDIGVKKNFSRFSAFLGPKIEKLEFHFVFMNFSWKSQEKIYRVFYFANVGQKRQF